MSLKKGLMEGRFKDTDNLQGRFSQIKKLATTFANEQFQILAKKNKIRESFSDWSRALSVNVSLFTQ